MQIYNDNLKTEISKPAILTLQYECAKLLHALGRTNDSLLVLSQSVSSYLKNGKCRFPKLTWWIAILAYIDNKCDLESSKFLCRCYLFGFDRFSELPVLNQI